MRKMLGLAMLVLVMGLAVSPALTNADAVSRSATKALRTSGCPCCSGNVTLPKDIQVQELKGVASYLVALKAFNTRDSIKLREYLRDQKLMPAYEKATVLIMEYNGTTTEIVKVPLVGPTSVGQLVYVKNTNGEAIAIGVGENNNISSIKSYIVEEGVVKEISPIEVQGFFGWFKCHTCELAVGGLCALGTATIARLGCAGACALVAALFIEDPAAVALWGSVCIPVCSWGVRVYGCDYGAHKICGAVEMCG